MSFEGVLEFIVQFCFMNSLMILLFWSLGLSTKFNLKSYISIYMYMFYESK